MTSKYDIEQQGDVLLFEDQLGGGNINLIDVWEPFAPGDNSAVIEMTTKFETMIYLTLGGGNVDDPGGDNKSKQFWGNFNEPDEDKHYRSEFQYLVNGLPVSTANLKILEEAAKRDLEKAFIKTKIANSLTVSASLQNRNTLILSIEIEAQGERSQFTFVENWESAA